MMPTRRPSPNSTAFPRSNSPQSGLSLFLSRPSKWFNRSPSASTTSEPRSSTSSTTRKPKISSPTDPRPIINSLQSDTYVVPAARSVLDLSSSRVPASLEMPPFQFPGTASTPHSPIHGDLRSISRRAWSKSADDLGKMSPSGPHIQGPPPPAPPGLSPITTSFQNKITQYRNRTNSNASGYLAHSPSSPSPSTHSLTATSNLRHPFPGINSTITPGSSPPHSLPDTHIPAPASLSAVSISVSAPSVDTDAFPGSAGSSPPGHVHIRSHSFTPRLPSKLTPRFGPASPKRKGSSGSGSDREVQDLDREPANPSSSAHTRPVRSNTLQPPPTIIEPGQTSTADEDEDRVKRSSQIVYHSGFLNLQSNTPPALLQYAATRTHNPNLTTLAKGWKPFKVELKGSKLLFFKPPSDRSAAIKDLFPSGLVPVLEDEEVPHLDDNDVKNRRTRDLTAGRKKRAYWGRRTHPDLISTQGQVQSGSLEALIHETVFATTFPDVTAPSSDPTPDTEKRREAWQDFASAVLLCLPPLVGQDKFELEFTRCCAYLVSGADDTVKEAECMRVGWIAGEYLKYQGSPADHERWDEWRIETIPNETAAVFRKLTICTLPSSSSTQALFVPTPQVGFDSPNVGTFSPRPQDASRAIPLGDTFGSGNSPSSPPRPTRKSSTDFYGSTAGSASSQAHIPWTALEQDGLTREILLSLDPRLIAQSLTLFHRSVLESTPENLTAGLMIGSKTSEVHTTPPTEDGLNDTSHRAALFKALFGSDEHPHWLTRLVLLQVLNSEGGYQAQGHGRGHGHSSSVILGGTTYDEQQQQQQQRHALGQPSRPPTRSDVIGAWVRIGELCRLGGDECSWRAIAAGLCAAPVARLDKAWRRVELAAVIAVEGWVYPHGAEGESAGVHEPRVTPWGGDMRERIEAEVGRAGGSEEDGWSVGRFGRVRGMFDVLRTAFSLCPRMMRVDDEDIGEDVVQMVGFWKEMALGDGGGNASYAAKFTRVEHFMSLSLAAEPRRKGLYEPLFWTRPSTSQSSRDALAPFLFPEPLPAVTFLDRGLPPGDVGPSRGGFDGHLQFEQWRRQPNSHQFLRQDLISFGGVSYGGTMIPVFDGELLLVVQPGVDSQQQQPPSRPPSSVLESSIPSPEKPAIGRAPSFRVKAGSSHGVERKSSTARRNSLPAISHRQSFVSTEPSSEPPLRVIVQAGALDRLVNVLVHGLQNVSVSVADDNGEMSLREGKTRELVVDRGEFAKVWWSEFRSFVTPLVFFELLRKLYVRSQPQSSSPAVGEYLTVTHGRSEVLATLREWLTSGSGAQDALDDSRLFAAWTSFCDAPTDHTIVQSPNFQEPAVRQAWRALQQAKDGLRSLFISYTKRPPRSVLKQSAGNARTRKVVQDADVDGMSPEQLVEYLDGMASATFLHVSEEDLFVTSDILEAQTADRIGWLPNREVNWNDEFIEIQTIYSHLREAQPSSLVSEPGPESLYKLLPPNIRSCIRAYGLLRKWLIVKLVVPNLGIRARQARMNLFLRAIEVARMRSPGPAAAASASSSSQTTPANSVARPRGHQPCVRSFVEALLTSAVLSIESRAHQRAWQGLAVNRGVQCDALASLLAKPGVQTVDSQDPLTVDIGWLMERMLEIMTTPDTVESLSEEMPQMLINYSKRRHLCNLITTAPIHSSRRIYQKGDVERSATELLNDIEREVNAIQFDIRAIKDEAYREGLQAGTNGITPNKKFSRAFQKTVALQVEKNKRDRNLRDRLIKEKRLEDTRSGRREDLFNKAMRPRKVTDPVQKQRRSKKSMSSAFMQFMRPISSAFASETLHVPSTKKSPSELDFVASAKPSLVVNLIEASVAQFINNERSFTFQLDTEDGGRYLMQALDRKEMTKWIDTISNIAKMAAKRRLTYVGSPKPQPSDHLYTNPMSASSRDPVAVFGVELNFLLRREAEDGEVLPGAIPSVVERCLSEVESRGLSEVGIYRIAGASTEINTLKDSFNRGEFPIEPSTDIHAVCDLIKYWFRVLPEPVFPPSSYFQVIEAMKLEDFDVRLDKIRNIVRSLPPANFDLLKRVAEHLDKVTDYEEHNHMTAEALAIVFSPNLLRAPHNDFVLILANMGHTHKLVKALITHFNAIFEETDAEVEMDHEEDEFDLPTLAEDEDEDELDREQQQETLPAEHEESDELPSA